MQKKNNRIGQKSKQRQKLSRRAVLIIAAAGFGCLGIALTLFINTSRIDESMAGISTYVVTEDEPVNDFTLEAPVIKQRPVIGPNTIMVKAVKPDKDMDIDESN